MTQAVSDSDDKISYSLTRPNPLYMGTGFAFSYVLNLQGRPSRYFPSTGYAPVANKVCSRRQ